MLPKWLSIQLFLGSFLELSRIQLIKKPPTLRMVYLKHDDPVPAGLDEWTLGIQIEEKNLTRVE